jgi:hypothetical protein
MLHHTAGDRADDTAGVHLPLKQLGAFDDQVRVDEVGVQQRITELHVLGPTSDQLGDQVVRVQSVTACTFGRL